MVMDSSSVSPSHQPSHDQWLSLSLFIAPQPQESQPQPQPQPQPQHLQQPQPQLQPQLLNLLETEPQPQSRPSTLAPLIFTPLAAPTPPFSPSQEHEIFEERYMCFSEPPRLPLPPPLPPLVHSSDDKLPEMRASDDFPSSSSSSTSSSSRKRKLNSKKKKKEGKSETIEAPFPWATNARAKLHGMKHLLENKIKSISGKVKCKGCQEEYDIEFDLLGRFVEVGTFITNNSSTMHDRAPDVWTNPVLPNCNRCGQENALRPVFNKKRNTNWLFLLLGGMIGCATLSHLKYFCKHNFLHCTAAKDRLVYLAYLALCKQLAPDAPLDL